MRVQDAEKLRNAIYENLQRMYFGKRKISRAYQIWYEREEGSMKVQKLDEPIEVKTDSHKYYFTFDEDRFSLWRANPTDQCYDLMTFDFYDDYKNREHLAMSIIQCIYEFCR